MDKKEIGKIITTFMEYAVQPEGDNQTALRYLAEKGDDPKFSWEMFLTLLFDPHNIFGHYEMDLDELADVLHPRVDPNEKDIKKIEERMVTILPKTDAVSKDMVEKYIQFSSALHLPISKEILSLLSNYHVLLAPDNNAERIITLNNIEKLYSLCYSPTYDHLSELLKQFSAFTYPHLSFASAEKERKAVQNKIHENKDYNVVLYGGIPDVSIIRQQVSMDLMSSKSKTIDAQDVIVDSLSAMVEVCKNKKVSLGPPPYSIGDIYNKISLYRLWNDVQDALIDKATEILKKYGTVYISRTYGIPRIRNRMEDKLLNNIPTAKFHLKFLVNPSPEEFAAKTQKDHATFSNVEFNTTVASKLQVLFPWAFDISTDLRYDRRINDSAVQKSLDKNVTYDAFIVNGKTLTPVPSFNRDEFNKTFENAVVKFQKEQEQGKTR